MRLDDEFYTVVGESFAQLMELLLGQNDPEMRDWHVMLIDMVAVFLWHEGIIDIAHDEFMREETISNVVRSTFYFVASDHLRVKLMRLL